MKKLLMAIRAALSIWLLIGIYFETGIFTTLAFGVLIIFAELVTHWIKFATAAINEVTIKLP